MRTWPYLHLDVFTDAPLEGNQLAVFPDSPGLEPRLMQAVAQEMAFAETTFILPKENPDTDVRMRIFTPSREMPLAGHPTVGSTFALAHTGLIAPDTARFTFGLQVGPTPVDLEWREGGLAFAWMNQPLPEFAEPVAGVAALAAGLAISESELKRTGMPVQRVSCGLPFLFIPLASREVVDSIQPNGGELERFARSNGLGGAGFFVFTLEGGDDGATVYSRMFAPEFGIVEDPATGSGSGSLGCYLVRHGLVPAEAAGAITSRQGVKMGRPSLLHIAIAGSSERITGVRVGGHAVLVGEGVLRVP